MVLEKNKLLSEEDNDNSIMIKPIVKATVIEQHPVIKQKDKSISLHAEKVKDKMEKQNRSITNLSNRIIEKGKKNKINEKQMMKPVAYQLNFQQLISEYNCGAMCSSDKQNQSC